MTNNYLDFQSVFFNNEFNEELENRNIDIIKNPFEITELNNNQYNKEEVDEDNSDIYFRKETSKSTHDNTNRNNALFNVTKEENIILNNFIGNKKGRKKNSEKEISKNSVEKNKKIHDKFDVFNIKKTDLKILFHLQKKRLTKKSFQSSKIKH